MHELMEYLIHELNAKDGSRYIIKHEGVEGDWYLKDIDIPVEDDAPLNATWCGSVKQALAFDSLEKIKDFAMEFIVPRPCSIIKITNMDIKYV